MRRWTVLNLPLVSIPWKGIHVDFLVCRQRERASEREREPNHPPHSGQIEGLKVNKWFKIQIFNFQKFFIRDFFIRNFDIINILCSYLNLATIYKNALATLICMI